MNGTHEFIARVEYDNGKLVKSEWVCKIVRCKDCNYIVRSEGVCRLLSNNYEPPVYVDDDDFCSHGVRRME